MSKRNSYITKNKIWDGLRRESCRIHDAAILAQGTPAIVHTLAEAKAEASRAGKKKDAYTHSSGMSACPTFARGQTSAAWYAPAGSKVACGSYLVCISCVDREDGFEPSHSALHADALP